MDVSREMDGLRKAIAGYLHRAWRIERQDGAGPRYARTKLGLWTSADVARLAGASAGHVGRHGERMLELSALGKQIARDNILPIVDILRRAKCDTGPALRLLQRVENPSWERPSASVDHLWREVDVALRQAEFADLAPLKMRTKELAGRLDVNHAALRRRIVAGKESGMRAGGPRDPWVYVEHWRARALELID